MRTAAMAVAVVASATLACKDKPSGDRPAARPAASSSPQNTAARPALVTAEVTGPGLVQTTRLSAVVTYSTTDLQVDGQIVAKVENELIDRQRFEVLAAVLEGKVRGDDPVGITLDVSIPYARLGYLINALQKAGFRNLALLTNGGKQMIPLELGDSGAVNASGLRMVVTLRGDRLTLWSLSGEEGTQKAPKLAVRWEGTRTLPSLTAALAEIARRRWPGGARVAEDRTIMIQLDRNADVGTLLNVLAAVRTDGSLELFPNIFLAGGV